MTKSELIRRVARRDEQPLRRDVETIARSLSLNIALPNRVKRLRFGVYVTVSKSPRIVTPTKSEKLIASKIADKLDEINATIESIL
ncbi:MAG: hypothetical protein WB816_02255 [Methylocystis sp.]